MIDVLLRRRQNNPLLTGEAGVGKTAVVEGLALAIANGMVPPKLANVRLMSLDVGTLLAGASMKGEFEARLKGVLEAAAKSPVPVILFVDEIHMLIGAGGQTGTGGAANLLKPALARGTLRTIGATTWTEYKRHIEKDPALTRRFQVLQVMEPEEAAAIDMVRGLSQTFAHHHGVEILDEAIRAAVTLRTDTFLRASCRTRRSVCSTPRVHASRCLDMRRQVNSRTSSSDFRPRRSNSSY